MIADISYRRSAVAFKDRSKHTRFARMPALPKSPKLSPMDKKEVGRRVKAARAYGGFKSPQELGEKIGIGRTTLYAIERGERRAKYWELAAIAEVCGLPRRLLTEPAEKIHALLPNGEDPPDNWGVE